MRARSLWMALLCVTSSALGDAGYGDGSPVVARHPLAVRIEALAVEAATAAHRTPPIADARLAHALELLAPRILDGQPPADALTSEALWLSGIVEPLPYLVVLTVSNGGDDDVLGRLRTIVAPLLVDGRYSRVAAVVRDLDPAHRQVLLALQESSIHVERVPRQAPVGATLPIAGTITPAYARAEVFATAPDGRNTMRIPVSGEAQRFSSGFVCATRGRWQLEVVADGRLGSTVLANFPVYCGERAPTALPGESSVASAPFVEPWSDAAEAERTVLAAINRDRAAAGLAPVVRDAALQQVARFHAGEMRDGNYVGHNSPTSGTPSDRVKRAGIVTPRLLLENVAVGSGPEQVEKSFMDSPAHRANLLNGEVDRVGVGAAVGGGVDAGGRELYVTELFARFAEHTDDAGATARLRARSEETRRAAHLPSLVSDPELERAAAAIARGLAEKTLASDGAGAIVKATSAHLGERYSSLRTILADAAEVGDLKLDLLAEATFTHAGIAAAVATTGDPRVHCVVLLASERRR